MGDDTDDSNLPVPRDEDRIERLKETVEVLEGEGHSDVLVPIQAHDIGDADVRENPRACDLGYFDASEEASLNDSSETNREVEGVECAVAANIGGTDRIMYDEENGDARIDCDADTFIENVEDWN